MKYVRHYVHSFLYGNPCRARAAAWLFADAASALTLMIGAISLSGYVLKKPWMYEGWLTGSVGMSPQGAIGFMLIGAGMLFIHRQKDTQL